MDPDRAATPPPEWAIKEAVRRCASTIAGHRVELDEVRWGMATFEADHTDPDGAVVPAGSRHLAFWLRELPDKTNTIGLPELTRIAAEIALQAQ